MCNARLISPIFNAELLDSAKADADADLMADVIRHHGLNMQSFDVIALNEVWDEDAKKILKNKLAPVFPYHVDKLDENTDLLGLSVPIPKAEDSGLMLFSRMPFVNFKVGNPASVTSVAFRCFAAGSGNDALAAKGVGLVVVRNPTTRRLYLVAFTHLQDGDREVRSAQMKEIRALIDQIPGCRAGFLAFDFCLWIPVRLGKHLGPRGVPQDAPAQKLHPEGHVGRLADEFYLVDGAGDSRLVALQAGLRRRDGQRLDRVGRD